MNDIISIVKGLYPLFFWLAVWGTVIKIRESRFKMPDVIVLTIVLVYLAGVIIQPLLFYGEIAVSRRYVLIITPLTFPWAAEGVMRLQKIIIQRGWNNIFRWIVAGLLMFLLYDAYSPIIKWRTSPKKSFERQMAFKTADFIQSDWQIEKNVDSINAGGKCDIYVSNQKPLVQSEILQIGYLSGGQSHNAYFQHCNISQDYIATQKIQPVIDGFKLMQTFNSKGRQWFIWKRVPHEVAP